MYKRQDKEFRERIANLAHNQPPARTVPPDIQESIAKLVLGRQGRGVRGWIRIGWHILGTASALWFAVRSMIQFVITFHTFSTSAPVALLWLAAFVVFMDAATDALKKLTKEL